MLKVNTVSNIKKVLEYVPVEFRDSDTPPVFYMKTLSIRGLAELDDALTKVSADALISLSTGSHSLKALKLSLTDWKNIVGQDDQAVPMGKDKDGTVSDVALEMLPSNIRMELSAFIVSASRFPDTAQELLGKL